MAIYTERFKSLVAAYRRASIDFPQLKPVTVAQWIYESGRGASKLATDHNNYAGLKWRDEMQGFATPVSYQAHDGTDRYCKFTSIETFIPGYWRFLERAPYLGWHDHADSGVDFIHFIGPIYTPTAGYGAGRRRAHPGGGGASRLRLADADGTEQSNPDDTHGSSEHPAKPPIKAVHLQPVFLEQERRAHSADRHALHDQQKRRGDDSVVSDPAATSLRPLRDRPRQAKIYQMVRDTDKAWHAKGANADSIGIEHSAAAGDSMTPAQTLSSVALVRWLLSEYKLPQTCHLWPQIHARECRHYGLPGPPIRTRFGSCHRSMGADQDLRIAVCSGELRSGRIIVFQQAIAAWAHNRCGPLRDVSPASDGMRQALPNRTIREVAVEGPVREQERSGQSATDLSGIACQPPVRGERDMPRG